MYLDNFEIFSDDTTGEATTGTMNDGTIQVVPTGTREVVTANNNIRIFPNPFSPTTTIDFSNIKKSATHNLSLFVYNLLGEEIAVYNDVTGNKLVIEKSHLGGTKGMYFYKATLDGENIGVGKLVVE